jgi:hypothetical protein
MQFNAWPEGRNIARFPVIATSEIADSGLIALADPSQIAVAEGNVKLDIASGALVEIDGELVSTWQNDLVALCARCYRSWASSSQAVAYITGETIPSATSARATKTRNAS